MKKVLILAVVLGLSLVAGVAISKASEQQSRNEVMEVLNGKNELSSSVLASVLEDTREYSCEIDNTGVFVVVYGLEDRATKLASFSYGFTNVYVVANEDTLETIAEDIATSEDPHAFESILKDYSKKEVDGQIQNIEKDSVVRFVNVKQI